jgi:hypothetical protein
MEFLNKLLRAYIHSTHATHAAHAAHAAHARRAALPFSWTAPWNGLIVWVAIEATSHRESHECKGKEECNAMIHRRLVVGD